MSTIQKSYYYKVYKRDGTYLGMLNKMVTSEYSHSEDINSGGSQITISVALNFDISALSNTTIDTESGIPIQAEDGSNLETERALDVVGQTSDKILLSPGNEVVIQENSNAHPNGVIMFSGSIDRLEPNMGGSSDNIVNVMIYSDGQDVNNHIISGTTQLTADINQQSQDQHWEVYNKLPDNPTYRLNFGDGNSIISILTQQIQTGNVGNIAAVDLLLSVENALKPMDVYVTIYKSYADAIGLGATWVALGITHNISATSPTQTRVAIFPSFGNKINPNATYFISIEGVNSSVTTGNGALLIQYQDTNILSGAQMYANVVAPNHIVPFAVGNSIFLITYFSQFVTALSYVNKDPIFMLRDFFGTYINAAGVIGSPVAGYLDSNITGTYTFNVNTVFEGIQQVLAMTPNGWFFYVGLGDKTLHFQQQSTTADHILVKNNDLQSIQPIISTENLVNTIIYSGGLVNGANLYSVYTNSASISKYGARILRISDQNLTDQSTMNLIAANILAGNSQPQYQASVTVLAEQYDITIFKPGDMIGFSGFGNFVDTLLLPIVRIEYYPDYAILTLGQIPPRFTATVQNISNGLTTVQTLANPTSPS